MGKVDWGKVSSIVDITNGEAGKLMQQIYEVPGKYLDGFCGSLQIEGNELVFRMESFDDDWPQLALELIIKKMQEEN